VSFILSAFGNIIAIHKDTEVIVRIYILGLTIGASMLSGCASVNIDGHDGNARFPEGEITIALSPVDRTNPKLRYNTLSMGYVRTSGESEQTVDTGDYVDINNVRIYGPTTLNNDLKLGVGYLRFVRHMFINQSFEWNWGAGFGYSNFNYTGTAGSQQLKFKDSALGVHGQVGLAYYLTPRVALEGNIGGYVFSSDNDSELATGQIVFAVTPVDAIRLFAGYRRWDYYMTPNQGMSDIQYRFSGPTAGLTLNF